MLSYYVQKATPSFTVLPHVESSIVSPTPIRILILHSLLNRCGDHRDHMLHFLIFFTVRVYSSNFLSSWRLLLLVPIPGHNILRLWRVVVVRVLSNIFNLTLCRIAQNIAQVCIQRRARPLNNSRQHGMMYVDEVFGMIKG